MLEVSIRIRSFATVLLVTLPATLAAASSEPITLLLEGQRREIATVSRNDVEMVPLDPLIQGLGVGTHVDLAGGAITLAYQGREVSLFHKKSLASVGGDLRLLSGAVLLEGSQWLIPVESVARLLGPLLGKPVAWRPASRVLLLGNVGIPRVTVTTYVSGDVVRVVLESSEKVPFRVLQQEGRVTVSIVRDLIETPFQQERLTGGIVDWVQFTGGRDNVFAVTPGRRFQGLKAYEQETPPRLTLEFQATAVAAAPPKDSPQTTPSPSTSPASGAKGTPRLAPPADPREPLPASSVTRTVVIDPGHGGAETGAKGPGGTLEKDIALSIARKLRSALANTMGIQVFMTRDSDVDLPLDERTAIANNYKADLFVSIHANASRSHGAAGSEVYFLSYQAGDEATKRLAAAEGEAFVPSTSAPPGSDLALILWDMAQAQYLEESSALASRIQEELAQVTGSEGRGVKQAPFRVLVGAAMPAVLVEVAFISNPEEEKLLLSDAYQGRVAGALMKGVARFGAEQSRRAGTAPEGGRSGR